MMNKSYTIKKKQSHTTAIVKDCDKYQGKRNSLLDNNSITQKREKVHNKREILYFPSSVSIHKHINKRYRL